MLCCVVSCMKLGALAVLALVLAVVPCSGQPWTVLKTCDLGWDGELGEGHSCPISARDKCNVFGSCNFVADGNGVFSKVCSRSDGSTLDPAVIPSALVCADDWDYNSNYLTIRSNSDMPVPITTIAPGTFTGLRFITLTITNRTGHDGYGLIPGPGFKISTLAPDTFKDMPRLNRITLMGLGISTIESGAFANLPSLQYVELGFEERLGSIPPGSAFVGVPVLTSFLMKHSPIRSLEETTFAGWPALESIALIDCALNRIPSNAFRKLTSLRNIYLSRYVSYPTFWPSITSVATEAFANLTVLEHVELSNNGITSLGPHTFSHLPALGRVNLEGNAIAQISASAFDNVPNLGYLNLLKNPLLNVESADLAAVAEIDDLRLPASFLFHRVAALEKMLAGLSQGGAVQQDQDWSQVATGYMTCNLGMTWSEILQEMEDQRISRTDRPNVVTGGLGSKMIAGKFEVWVCRRQDPCAVSPEDLMCYVYDEQQHIFLPWDSNSELKIVRGGPFWSVREGTAGVALAAVRKLQEEIQELKGSISGA